MSEPALRLVSRGQAHGTGEHSFDGSGFKGVNLFCDAGHDRQFVAALIFDETTGSVVPRDGISKSLEGPDGTRYQKWKFRCLECKRVTVVLAAKLDCKIAALVHLGVTELSLSGLDGILRRK